ncbi:MAG: RDD family protein [Planctomycetes bacterium]|nr:RDD family protein [Planctomycetota bacterium]
MFVERERIETPEHVPVEFEVAGPMSRALAGALDLLLISLALLAVALLALLVAAATGIGSTLREYALAALLLGWFAIFLGYHPFFELRRNGQTPGKRALGLRVLRQDGLPVEFRSAIVRNLLRLVDMQPGLLYGVAFVCMVATRRGARLGDLAAGTWVVRERREPLSQAGAPRLPAPGRTSPPGGEAPAPARAGRLTREEYAVVERFLGRRGELEPLRRRQLAREIAHPILERLGVSGVDPERFLEEEHARGVGRRLL